MLILATILQCRALDCLNGSRVYAFVYIFVENWVLARSKQSTPSTLEDAYMDDVYGRDDKKERHRKYRSVSNIRRTKSQNLNATRLIL